MQRALHHYQFVTCYLITTSLPLDYKQLTTNHHLYFNFCWTTGKHLHISIKQNRIMGRKKYESRTTWLHSTLYRDDWNKNCGYEITLHLECAFGRVIYFNLHQLDWGSAAREWYGHDLWKDITISDKQALEKLAGKYQARTPEQLLKNMTERFTPYKEYSFDKIREFLDRKEIPYRYLIP